MSSLNTFESNVNEILLGYYCLGSWSGYNDLSYVKLNLNEKKEIIGEDKYLIQSSRAKIMASASLHWAKNNGYKGDVKKVWWIGTRSGVFSRAIGYEVNSKTNPTDVLLQFADGKFLGVSAKSYKVQSEVGIKNSGLGTIDKDLGINLVNMYKKSEDDFIEEFELSPIAKVRKDQIRKNKNIVDASNEARTLILNKLRNSFYTSLNKLSNNELKNYIINDWMNANTVIRPNYIKVTGYGNKSPHTATVENPLKNNKMSYMETKPLKLQKIGNDTVGVLAGEHRIIKIRIQFSSQAMASSLKVLAFMWK